MTRAATFSAASHKTSTLRSPDFASSMILAAIASSARWTRCGARRAARAISNAMPMRRVVSGSNIWPSKNGRTSSHTRCVLVGRARADLRKAFQRTQERPTREPCCCGTAAPLWHGKSLWCRHCFASRIAAAEAERAKAARGTSLDFLAVKVQTEPTSKRQRKAFGLSIPKLH